MGIAALLAPVHSSRYILPVIIPSMIRDSNFRVNNTAIVGVNFRVPAFLVIAYLLWA